MTIIDKEQLLSRVQAGESMSQVAADMGITVSTVSKHCKIAGIRSVKTTPAKVLPLEIIKNAYEQGDSWYALAKRYNIAPHNLKNRLLHAYPSLTSRTMDEAKRPDILNDVNTLEESLKQQSARSLARKLNVQLATVSAAVRRLEVHSPDRISKKKITDGQLAYLYCEERKSIQWLCDTYNITRPNLLIRMDKLGIREGMRDYITDNPMLRDPQKIFELYDAGWSIGQLAEYADCAIGTVVYYFKKHDKQQRTIQQVYQNLRFANAKHRQIETQWGTFNLQSNQEYKFLKSVSPEQSLFYEPTTYEWRRRQYTPDFIIDGQHIEVKPRERSCDIGPNRAEFIKQMLVAKANDISIKTWYNGEYYDYPDIEDMDVYFAIDWKLFFNDHQQLSDWLLEFGFHPLRWPKMKLWGAFNRIVPEIHALNANHSHPRAIDFIQHFCEHYWYSHRKGYKPIVDAWAPGNTIILRNAVERIWDKQDTNIYRLIRTINTEYKDYMLPSIFKPWVAEYIYQRYLTAGDTVYDPCIGWGGRLIGTKDNNIRYIGSDLNPNSVESGAKIQQFLYNFLCDDNQFFQADASTVRRDMLPAKVDMIFTSPPYDDTETYHGLSNQCVSTESIYKNLFSLGVNKVVLNIPARHSDAVKDYAVDGGYNLMEELSMRTSAPIRRTKMSEPIICFTR